MNFQCMLCRFEQSATIPSRSLQEKFQAPSEVTLCRWSIRSRRTFFMFSVEQCKTNSSKAASHARGLKLAFHRCENSRCHVPDGFCLISSFARSVGDQFPPLESRSSSLIHDCLCSAFDISLHTCVSRQRDVHLNVIGLIEETAINNEAIVKFHNKYYIYLSVHECTYSVWFHWRMHT